MATSDILRNIAIKGLKLWKRFHHRYPRAYFKWHKRHRHLYRDATRFAAEWLHARGIKRVYLGYPYMISQGNSNEYNTNI